MLLLTLPTIGSPALAVRCFGAICHSVSFVTAALLGRFLATRQLQDVAKSVHLSCIFGSLGTFFCKTQLRKKQLTHRDADSAQIRRRRDFLPVTKENKTTLICFESTRPLGGSWSTLSPLSTAVERGRG
jgi:hypothetical protein